MGQRRVPKSEMVKKALTQPKTAAEYEFHNREARSHLSKRLTDIQNRALAPINQDPDVCPCGEIECDGFCESNIWAVRVLLEAIASAQMDDKEFLVRFRDVMP